MSNLNLSNLLKAKVHLGHETSNWNPKMLPYLYGEIKKNHIIDLNQSLKLLKKANNFVESAAYQGKKFLFVGTKREVQLLIAQEATRSNSFFVNSRWLGGMLTNWETIRTRISDLNALEQEKTKNLSELFSKKELANQIKELDRLQKYLNGIKTMQNLPDIAIIIDQKREITAISECKKLNIPIISLLDSDSNPDLIDIPIPGNDDSEQSLKFILNSLTTSIIKGQKKRNFRKI